MLGLEFGGLDAVPDGGHGGRSGKRLHPLPHCSELHDDVGVPRRDDSPRVTTLRFPEKDCLMIEQSQEQQEHDIGSAARLMDTLLGVLRRAALIDGRPALIDDSRPDRGYAAIDRTRALGARVTQRNHNPVAAVTS